MPPASRASTVVRGEAGDLARLGTRPAASARLTAPRRRETAGSFTGDCLSPRGEEHALEAEAWNQPTSASETCQPPSHLALFSARRFVGERGRDDRAIAVPLAALSSHLAEANTSTKHPSTSSCNAPMIFRPRGEESWPSPRRSLRRFSANRGDPVLEVARGPSYPATAVVVVVLVLPKDGSICGS